MNTVGSEEVSVVREGVFTTYTHIKQTGAFQALEVNECFQRGDGKYVLVNLANNIGIAVSELFYQTFMLDAGAVPGWLVLTPRERYTYFSAQTFSNQFKEKT